MTPPPPPHTPSPPPTFPPHTPSYVLHCLTKFSLHALEALKSNRHGRVEWEMWTSTNDGCGNSCDIQTRFKKEFRDTAVQLEKVQCHPNHIHHALDCVHQCEGGWIAKMWGGQDGNFCAVFRGQVATTQGLHFKNVAPTPKDTDESAGGINNAILETVHDIQSKLGEHTGGGGPEN